MREPLKLTANSYNYKNAEITDFHICIKSRHYNIRVVFTLYRKLVNLIANHYCDEFKTNVKQLWLNCKNVKLFLNSLHYMNHWYYTGISRKD